MGVDSVTPLFLQRMNSSAGISVFYRRTMQSLLKYWRKNKLAYQESKDLIFRTKLKLQTKREKKKDATAESHEQR